MSEEKTQSFKRYPTYDEWVEHFLEKMIALQHKALKKNCYNLNNPNHKAFTWDDVWK